MADKTLEYPGQTIVIRYEPHRCIHAAECVHGLPDVFDPQRKPWIDPQAADIDAIVGVIERCPTGALTYERLDDGPAEINDPVNALRIVADGPLYLRGDIELEDELGVVHPLKRLALCRCGASAHKPFCDGSHSKAGFEDAGELENGGDIAEATIEPGILRIRCLEDGPLIFSGPVRVQAPDDSCEAQTDGALCRCGASSTKPYCDGSHRRVGFSSRD